MADIDRFKGVNDELGHDRGDRVLIAVCRTMETSIRREIDTLVRYGGDEFVVVLPESTEGGAEAAAERMRRVVAQGTLGDRRTGVPLRVTVSVGVACFPRDGATAEGLVRSADRSMYQAKALGRNRVASPRTPPIGVSPQTGLPHPPEGRDASPRIDS
jgi:diguanylate cyclase (GGDEF)-like protein